MAKKTGADFYTSVSTLLNGFEIDSTLFYDLLETARSIREGKRPWSVLKKLDQSQSVSTSDTYLTAKTIPADFVRLAREGNIFLFDEVDTWQTLWEVPFEYRLLYKDDSSKFCMDYNSGQFFILGTQSQTFTIVMPYIADNGAITSSTTWLNFPSRYDMILAYEVAAMWRLGVDYDDINARNADSNFQAAERLYKMAETWDNELALSAVTQMDYPTPDEEDGQFINRKINL